MIYCGVIPTINKNVEWKFEVLTSILTLTFWVHSLAHLCELETYVIEMIRKVGRGGGGVAIYKSAVRVII